MKVFELDDVKRHEGQPETEIPTGRIRFKVNDTCYYSVSVDSATGGLKLYKSGFPDDRIVITMQGANIALIK
jgi:hypothetical protein